VKLHSHGRPSTVSILSNVEADVSSGISPADHCRHQVLSDVCLGTLAPRCEAYLSGTSACLFAAPLRQAWTTRGAPAVRVVVIHSLHGLAAPFISHKWMVREDLGLLAALFPGVCFRVEDIRGLSAGRQYIHSADAPIEYSPEIIIIKCVLAVLVVRLPIQRPA